MRIEFVYNNKRFFLSLERWFIGAVCLTAIILMAKMTYAVTPNPGHPWSEVGDGVFQVTGPSTMRTFTYPDANATVLTDNADVTVAQGGTGWNTLQANTVLLGNGTGAIATTTAGTNGFVLALSGGVPTWVATSTLANISGTLGLSGGGTNASLTASNGGIVYSGASALAVLGGTATAGQILRSGANAAPSWSTATYPATAGTSGNVLASDGTNFVSTAPDDPVFFTTPGLHATNLTTVTAFITASSTYQYIGVAAKPYTSCNVLVNVTTAAASITWAEVGIFKGTPVLNGAASLTRLGFTSVSGTFNSTGIKNTAVTATVAAGDPLWVALGSQATTPFQLRGMLADTIQTGVIQTALVRPSLASSPQATQLATATLVPSWVMVKCQ